MSADSVLWLRVVAVAVATRVCLWSGGGRGCGGSGWLTRVTDDVLAELVAALVASEGVERGGRVRLGHWQLRRD